MYSNTPFMTSVQISGSTFSAAAVEPFTSQNNIVITRRSPTIEFRVRADSNLVNNSCGRYRLRLKSVLLLSPSRLAPDESSLFPQFIQNFAWSGLDAWQVGQFIKYHLYPKLSSLIVHEMDEASLILAYSTPWNDMYILVFKRNYILRC